MPRSEIGVQAPPCVVLAGSSWGSTLHVARALGPRGVPVFVGATGAGAEVYRRSRWVAGARRLDPSDPVALVEEVADWLGDELPDAPPAVVVPTSDQLFEVLVEARDALAPSLVASLPPTPTARDLLDKDRSFALAARAGLDVPPWRRVAERADVAAVAELTLPVVVRPARWSTGSASARKVEVLRTDDACRDRLLQLVDEGAELVVQEAIETPDDAVELAIVWRAADGSSAAVCTGRKRRQSHADGGVMVWGEAVDREDLRQDTLRFLDESGFVGVGGLEVIRRGDRRWFVEFNPRLEAIHFLAARAGIDTVDLLHRDLTGAGVPTPIPRQGPATAWVGAAWLQQIIDDPARWSSAMGDRIAFARSPGRVRAVWDWSDPGPGMALTADLVRRGAGRVTGRRRAPETTG